MIDFNLFFAVMAIAIVLCAFAYQFSVNSLAIQVWWLNLQWTVSRWFQGLPLAFARRMPNWLVYWCVIVAGAHATTGKWGATDTPSTTLFDVLKRWEEKRKGAK